MKILTIIQKKITPEKHIINFYFKAQKSVLFFLKKSTLFQLMSIQEQFVAIQDIVKSS